MRPVSSDVDASFVKPRRVVRSQSSGRFSLALVICLLFVSNFAVSANLWSQDASTPVKNSSDPSAIPEFSKLRTPESPAFLILGLAPSVIERPSSPDAVAVSALAAFTNGTHAVIPSNYAIDVAPYWLVSHPSLSFTEYRKPGFASIYRLLGFSVATSDSAFKTAGATPHDTSVSRIGAGMRTVLYNAARPDTKCVGVLLALDEKASKELSRRQSLPNGRAVVLTDAQQKVIVDSIFASDTTHAPCIRNGPINTGFLVSGAAGTAFRFPAAAADKGTLSAYAFWLTPAYVTTSMSHILLLRWARSDGASRLSAHSVDLGFREVGAWSSYAVSGEFVARHYRDTTTSRQYRADLGFSVKTGDSQWLNVTFGKDFESGRAGSLIAIANLKWKFGKDPGIAALTAADIENAKSQAVANQPK